MTTLHHSFADFLNDHAAPKVWPDTALKATQKYMEENKLSAALLHEQAVLFLRNSLPAMLHDTFKFYEDQTLGVLQDILELTHDASVRSDVFDTILDHIVIETGGLKKVTGQDKVLRLNAFEGFAFSVATAQPKPSSAQIRRAENLWGQVMNDLFEANPHDASLVILRYKAIEDPEASQWMGFKVTEIPAFVHRKAALFEARQQSHLERSVGDDENNLPDVGDSKGEPKPDVKGARKRAAKRVNPKRARHHDKK